MLQRLRRFGYGQKGAGGALEAILILVVASLIIWGVKRIWTGADGQGGARQDTREAVTTIIQECNQQRQQ